MWYQTLRSLIRFYSKVYFRKIYFSGVDQLPPDKPLILACNHPTAFIEPALGGAISLTCQNFLLRGDMFGNGKISEAFLKSIKCIPIYRFQDGFAAMKKNEEILEYCYDLLGEGNNIFILAEGVAKHEKRMRPIQKGTARMAFGAYEKYKRADISVVPVGINYTNAIAFRSIIYTDFGKPIPLSEFLEDHEKNPRRAIKKLTDRVSKEMRKRIIHIAQEADDELGNQLLKITENTIKEKAFPRISFQPSRQFEMWEKIERMNALVEEDKNNLKQDSSNYFSQLQQLGLKDVGIAQKQYSNIWVLLALLVGLPAFLVGIVGNFLPVKVGKHFAEKLANTLEFNSSLRLVLEMAAYVVYFLLLFILAVSIGNYWHLIFVVLLPLFGHFSLQWLDSFNIWWAGQKAKQLPKEKLTELEQLRNKLSDF